MRGRASDGEGGSRSITHSESEVWLIFHKKHTGKPSVAYKDALDEALCYGWIDSLIKRIDDDRYARKFTPRKPDSNWSSINVKRYNELKAAKRLAPPGLERSPKGRPIVDGRPGQRASRATSRRRSSRHEGVEVLRGASRRRTAALYISWIDSAKREETRQKRLRAGHRRCCERDRNPGSHVTGPSASSSSTRARTSSASFSRSETSMPRVSTGLPMRTLTVVGRTIGLPFRIDAGRLPEWPPARRAPAL